jgi:hypothetical protein
VIEIVA